MTLLDDYTRYRHECLEPVAATLCWVISDHLRDLPAIDRVTARAKDPISFVKKAERVDDTGHRKYRAPLTEIQDQVGVRVVVFYLANVEQIRGRVLSYLRPIEHRTVVPEYDWEFGYFSEHHVLAMPSDAVPRGLAVENAPQFFELQIKTVFQHAWSEAEHDLGYKAPAPPNSDQQRRLAYAAAQAWGADRLFDELRSELALPRRQERTVGSVTGWHRNSSEQGSRSSGRAGVTESALLRPRNNADCSDLRIVPTSPQNGPAGNGARECEVVTVAASMGRQGLQGRCPKRKRRC